MSDPQLAPAPTASTRRSRGRPTLYSPAVADAICDFIRLCGGTVSHAAAFAGLSPKTVLRWRADRPEFADALDFAHANFLEARLTSLCAARQRNGRPDWRAHAWLIERTFPEEYGRRARIPPASSPPDHSQGESFPI